MAKKYVDHGLYTYSATPTWGVAQDGDGLAATGGASAIAEVDCSGSTCDAGDTIVIAGATLTCVASGAGANQYNAGTGSSLVTNLVSAINAATNTVAQQGGTETWATPQVREYFYARAKPGVATTLQIMTRYAAARFNHATNSGMAISTSGWSSAPTITQFAGGASGPWGWLFNPSSISFVEGSAAINAYGALVTTKVGTVVDGDVVICRTKRSGANITASYPGASNPDLTVRAGGTAASPKYLVFDDGTEWAGDSGQFQVTFGTRWQLLWIWPASYWVVQGKDVSGTKTALFTASYGTLDGAAVGWTCLGTRYLRVENVHFQSTSGTSNVDPFRFWQTAFTGHDPTAFPTWVGCKFDFGHVSHAGMHVGNGDSAAYAWTAGWRAIQCEWDFTRASPSAAVNPIVFTSWYADAIVELIGCKFTGLGNYDNKLFSVGNGARRARFRVLDGTLTNINPLGGLMGTFDLAGGLTDIEQDKYLLVGESEGSRRFGLETPRGIVEWSPMGGYPTYGAYLPDGVTKWSMRVLPSNASGRCGPTTPFRSPKLIKMNTLGLAVRTARMELLIDTDYSDLTNAAFSLECVYQQSDGSYNRCTSYVAPGASPANLIASSAVWSVEPPTYVVGGVSQSYNKRYITLTTPTAVKADTEMRFFFCVHKPSPSLNDWIFIDPEIQLT